MVAHHTGVPKDLMAHRPELDPRIKRIVSKAMARDPEKRYATAREFVESWSGVVGIEIEVRDTAEQPVTGRASRQRQDGRATGDGSAQAPGQKRDEQGARSRGLLGWLKRNRD